MQKQNEKISQTLKALGSPMRLDIICYLVSSEKCVCSIFDHLKLPQNLVSHHLRILRENELIKARKAGKWVYYSLDSACFIELEKFIKTFSSTKKPKISCKC